MSKPKRSGSSVFAENRRARRMFTLQETVESGMVLTGAEVKSCRAGKIQLADAYATIRNGEIWLHNAHISAYTHATVGNAEPVRMRKLLLHRREIDRLAAKVQQKGLTLIPTKVYASNGRIKCEIALAKGKQLYDKRDEKRKAIEKDEAREAVRNRRSRA
ncbi:MAG: SsrA-binding protein SmpB [Bryobacterales bacterium]|nr:SsrA-binding protein SmpB [Bryobacterales bacterium]MDE0264008.1 SsrA-binding protein SmpB [Bryobacterales bacterium]MDE0622109.1 SsrA-binding protein SmpB [Bryobacterales bacterium]